MSPLSHQTMGNSFQDTTSRRGFAKQVLENMYLQFVTTTDVQACLDALFDQPGAVWDVCKWYVKYMSDEDADIFNKGVYITCVSACKHIHHHSMNDLLSIILTRVHVVVLKTRSSLISDIELRLKEVAASVQVFGFESVHRSACSSVCKILSAGEDNKTKTMPFQKKCYCSRRSTSYS